MKSKTSVLFCIDWWPESTQGNKWVTHMVMFTQSSIREIQQKVCEGEQYDRPTLFTWNRKSRNLKQVCQTWNSADAKEKCIYYNLSVY